METLICGFSGKLVNVCRKIEEPKPSKNKMRKAKRYGSKRKPRVGVTGYQFATQITHRARFGCNPETKLILQGC